MPHYILQGHTPVPVDDILTWARWFEEHDRKVGLATWRDAGGRELARVSTVFLGLDHGWHGLPLLFETMIFWPGHELDEYQWRHASWDEAAAEHERTCAVVREHLGAPA
jgi:hypothetical protein